MYIYETTNLVNGKKYRGKSESKKFKPNYHGSGRRVRLAVKKYGAENFKTVLIEECDSREQLCEREKYWIADLRKHYPPEMIYNIAPGGEGGDTYSKNDNLDKIKEKIGNAHRGRIIVNKDGKEYHIIADKLEEYLSRGYKKGRGDFVKSDTYREAQRNRWLGRKRTEKNKQKLSKSLKGRIYSEETKLKMSESARKREHTYWVYNKDESIKIKYNMIEEYLSRGYKRGRGYSPNKGRKMTEEQKALISKRTKEAMMKRNK